MGVTIPPKGVVEDSRGHTGPESATHWVFSARFSADSFFQMSFSVGKGEGGWFSDSDYLSRDDRYVWWPGGPGSSAVS